MVDYSFRGAGRRRGTHATTLDPPLFHRFLQEYRTLDMDFMLEIKNKEASALAALQAARGDPRLVERIPEAGQCGGNSERERFF